jgi:hypothetical protein
MGEHPQLEGFEPLQEDPGVEGTHGRPRGSQDPEDRLADQLAIADDGAPDTTSLSVQILGGRVDHQVGAELQRPLQRRRAEAIVDRQQTAAAVRDLGEQADIHHLGQRVGRRLAEKEPGLRANRRVPGRQGSPSGT